MCILCWNPLSYILLCHNIESPLLRRRNGYGRKGQKGGGGGLGFTTVGGSGCENVSHHVAIQIITMVLPFKFLGVGRVLGLTTVDGSGC